MGSVLALAGTWSEAVRAAAIAAAARRAGLDAVTLHAANLAGLAGLPAPAALPRPDAVVDPWSLGSALAAERPAALVLCGTSEASHACAVAAERLGQPFSLADAGLRSSPADEPRRQACERLAEHLFTSGAQAAQRLVADGRPPSSVVVSGSLLADAVAAAAPRSRGSDPLFAVFAVGRLVDEDDVLTVLHQLEAAVVLSRCVDTRVVVAPAVVLGLAERGVGQALLRELRPYLVDRAGPAELVALLDGCGVAVTDCGVVQETAALVGARCLTAARAAERPETVAAGANRVVGTETEPIVEEALRVLEDVPQRAPRPPLWDGQAADRVVEHVAAGLAAPEPSVERARRDVDAKIVRGSLWVALSWGGRNLLSLLAMLVLARLLEPAAFGIVALVSVLVLVLTYLQESGMNAALVYRRDDLRRAAGSALVLSCGVGVALGGALALAAPLVAGAFGLPEATDVIRAMSLLLVLTGLGIAPGALLERELDFRSRAKGELAAGLSQAGCALGLAFAGFGVWSLVAGQLVGALVQTAVFWALVPWRPSPRNASVAVMRELVRYGRFVTAGNLLGLANQTLDKVVIARVLGAAALGVYTVGWRIADFPTAVVGYVVSRVMFPAYTRLRDDDEGFRRAFVQTIERVGLLTLPLAAAFVVAAEPLVLGLLGSRWEAAVEPIRILALYTMVRCFTSPTGAVFQAKGRPELVPLLALPQLVVLVPALLLLAPRFGVSGAAVAILAGFTASAVPAVAVALHLLRLRAVDLMVALAPGALCAAAVAGTLAALLRPTEDLEPLAALAVLTLAGAAAYALSASLVGRRAIAPIWAGLRGSQT